MNSWEKLIWKSKIILLQLKFLGKIVFWKDRELIKKNQENYDYYHKLFESNQISTENQTEENQIKIEEIIQGKIE